MYTHFNYSFQKEIVTIHPGEYYVSSEEIYISTILGSCISVALHDPQLKIGGLNHYMLPSTFNGFKNADNSGRYGEVEDIEVKHLQKISKKDVYGDFILFENL